MRIRFRIVSIIIAACVAGTTGFAAGVDFTIGLPTATNQNAWIDSMKKRMASDPKFAKLKLVQVAYGQESAQINQRLAKRWTRRAPRSFGHRVLRPNAWLVLLDQGKRLLRPAIIWADQRSADFLLEIEARVGRSLLAQRCGTAPTAGFAIASLCWLQGFEAQTLERAATMMLPKDFSVSS